MSAAYVVMYSDSPRAAAPTLAAAQASAEAAETRYTGTESRELRWSQRGATVWRLMSRGRHPETGKGRGRFMLTARAVHAVLLLDEDGAR
jgi:hypothetical protein